MSRSSLLVLLKRLLSTPARDASARDGGLSRRELITRTLGGVALAGLAGTGTSACGDDDDAGDTRDVRDTTSDTGLGDTSGDTGPDDAEVTPTAPVVIVVGGGMAGVHATYRLRQAGVAVTLYEASDRLGGRMWTKRDGFEDGQLCEIGGELIDDPHTIMHSLAEELDIQLDDLLAGVAPTETAETFFFNGRHISAEEIRTEWAPLAPKLKAALDEAESDDDAFARLDNTSIPDFLVEAEAGPLIKEILEVAYTEEYGLEAAQQPILNLLYLIDAESSDELVIFGESNERYHTHLGNDLFITRLSAGFGDSAVTNAALVELADGEGGRYVATFERQADGPDGDAGTRFEVIADHVVLTLPFTLLRKVDLSGLALPQTKAKIIEELGYGTNAKLMMQFSRRVWQTDHDASGATFSDNGIQTSWDTTRGQAGAHGIITNFVGGDIGVAMGEGTAEERALAILPAFDEVYPGMQAAYVEGSAVRMHWPTYKWTLGSYACYTLGQWSFYGIEGTRVGGLHFAGEHTSQSWQGYMEGAAESGVFAAIEVLEALGKDVPESLSALVADRDPPLPPEEAFADDTSSRRRRFVRSRAERSRALARSMRAPGVARRPAR